MSRTIGHVESKIKDKGNLSEIVIAEPEVKVLDLNVNMDFVIAGTQGIFDYLSPEKAVEIVGSAIQKWKEENDDERPSLQEVISSTTIDLIQEAILMGSEDNVSVMIILLSSYIERKL